MKPINFVIVFGTVISGILALSIILVPVVGSFISNYTVPKVIENWGGVVVGFYFGSLTNFILQFYKNNGDAAPK